MPPTFACLTCMVMLLSLHSASAWHRGRGPPNSLTGKTHSEGRLRGGGDNSGGSDGGFGHQDILHRHDYTNTGGLYRVGDSNGGGLYREGDGEGLLREGEVFDTDSDSFGKGLYWEDDSFGEGLYRGDDRYGDRLQGDGDSYGKGQYRNGDNYSVGLTREGEKHGMGQYRDGNRYGQQYWNSDSYGTQYKNDKSYSYKYGEGLNWDGESNGERWNTGSDQYEDRRKQRQKYKDSYWKEGQYFEHNDINQSFDPSDIARNRHYGVFNQMPIYQHKTKPSHTKYQNSGINTQEWSPVKVKSDISSIGEKKSNVGTGRQNNNPALMPYSSGRQMRGFGQKEEYWSEQLNKSSSNNKYGDERIITNSIENQWNNEPKYDDNKYSRGSGETLVSSNYREGNPHIYMRGNERYNTDYHNLQNKGKDNKDINNWNAKKAQRFPNFPAKDIYSQDAKPFNAATNYNSQYNAIISERLPLEFYNEYSKDWKTFNKDELPIEQEIQWPRRFFRGYDATNKKYPLIDEFNKQYNNFDLKMPQEESPGFWRKIANSDMLKDRTRKSPFDREGSVKIKKVKPTIQVPVIRIKIPKHKKQKYKNEDLEPYASKSENIMAYKDVFDYFLQKNHKSKSSLMQQSRISSENSRKSKSTRGNTSVAEPKLSARSFQKMQDQIASRRKDITAERMDILKDVEDLFVASRRKDLDKENNIMDEKNEQLLIFGRSTNYRKDPQSMDTAENGDNLGVLNMIKSLQDEIQEIDQEIDSSLLEEQKQQKDKLEAKSQIVHTNSSAEIDVLYNKANETLDSYLTQEKLLDDILQIREELKNITQEIEIETNKINSEKIQENKEQSTKINMRISEKNVNDTTGDKLKFSTNKILVEVILNKKKENKKLDEEFNKLAERRKVIGTALKQQMVIADMNKRMALLEVERQKTLLDEQQKRELQLKDQENTLNKFLDNLSVENSLQEDNSIEESKRLQKHKHLVQESNKRILAKIKTLKNQREREAQILKDNWDKITDKMKNKKTSKQQERLRLLPEKSEMIQEKIAEKLRRAIASSALDLNQNEKKKALEWLDLKRNAAILQKTDRAIDQKLKAKDGKLGSEKLTILDYDFDYGHDNHYVYDDYHYDHDYYDYADVLPQDYVNDDDVNVQSSGSSFLTNVAGILGEAEESLDFGKKPHVTLAGSLRHNLLGDVEDHVLREINSLPGGRVATKVYHNIPLHGIPPHGIPPHDNPPHGVPPHDINSHAIPPHPHGIPPHSISTHDFPHHDINTHSIPPHTKFLRWPVDRHEKQRSFLSASQSLRDREEYMRNSRGSDKISFSNIMGDLLTGKPSIPGLL